MIFQKIFANSDNSDLLGNSFYFKGKANLWMKMMEVVSYFCSINAPCVGDNKRQPRDDIIFLLCKNHL